MRIKWLIGGLVVVAVGAQGTALWLNRDDDRGAVAVATVAVDRGEVTVDVAATGTVRAATTRSLGFSVDGTVEKVAVRAGSKVKAGAVLATVDDTDAADALADARESLDVAESDLDDAETRAAATRRSRAMRAAQQSTAQQRAAQQSRAQQGAAQQSGAQQSGAQQGAAQQSGAQQSRAQQSGAQQGTTQQGAAQQSRTAGVDPILAAERRVNQAEADLAEAEVALHGTTITAPISGTVMTVAGQVGSVVSQGTAFITLADTYRMQVFASFPEADAGDLAPGQSATVTLADRAGEELEADVVQVDPVGADDGALVTYGVLLSLATQPADLLVGQSAAVEVRTGEVANALRVPSTAVHDAGAGKGVVLVRRGNANVERDVTVGLRGDQYTEITAGLEAGEPVVRSW